MTAPTVPLLLEVHGLDRHAIAAQAMQNLWVAGRDAADDRLAVVDVQATPVASDLLERLTWALLAWPSVSTLTLVDRTTGTRVARVERAPERQVEPGGSTHAWCDYWLPPDAMPPAGRGNDDGPAGVAFPPRPVRRGPGALFSLDQRALALRERAWQRINGMLGERVAVLLYRLYQRLAAAYRRRSSPPSTIDLATEARLQALQGGGQASGQGLAVALLVARLSPGGAEKSALDLGAALSRAGVRVHIVTTLAADNSWSDRARAAGAQVLHLPDFLPRNTWLPFLRSYLRRLGVAVLHISNSHWMYEQLPELRRDMPDLRVVSQLHAEGRPGAQDYLTLAARVDAQVDRHTVISNYLKDRLVTRHAIDPGRIAVIRTGIDLGAEFDPVRYRRGAWRDSHGIPARAALVAFIGRFSDLKRPLLFVEVAAQVLAARPGVTFVMQGEGPLRPAIDAALDADPALRGAFILEPATAPVQPLMVDADLLVLTSAMEGIAYVSYEAMALGLPQVSAAVGAQSELLGPDSGVLVETGEGEAGRFAEAVIALLDDPERRAALAAAGRQRIRRWPDVDRMAARYQELYAELLDRAPGAAGMEKVVDSHTRGVA